MNPYLKFMGIRKKKQKLSFMMENKLQKTIF